MKLSATAVRKAKPKEKPYKMPDGKGLYLLANPAGSKYWRWDYRFNGLRKTMALGVYPDVTLAKARDDHMRARQLLAEGIDPNVEKRAAKEAKRGADTFEAIALEWYAKQLPRWAEATADAVNVRLEKHALPWLGHKRINTITAPEVLAVLRRVETAGAYETAHRVKQYVSQIYIYAIASGRATMNPAAGLSKALISKPNKHFASIKEPKRIGPLLRAIDGYEGSFVTRCALQLAPLVFVRPGELRAAEWDELDFDKAEWRISAERMKMRQPHIVPLSRQAVLLLDELRPLTGHGRYVFPSLRTAQRPMSDGTLNAALRRIGYTPQEMQPHGFRSMASTRLNEAGWRADAIERQLAHVEKDAVRAAYNEAQHLPERRKMMQWWADYLDGLKRGAHVIAINERRA